MLKNDGTTSTASSHDAEPLTFSELRTLLDSMPEEPIAVFMRSKGFDPKNGGVLLWPASQPVDWGIFGPPSYVRISQHVSEPMLINA